MIQAATQRPTLVVLDVKLPVVDGYAVAQSLRSRYGTHLPILVITGDGQAAMKARRLGAYSYVRKPFDVVDLVGAVLLGIRAGEASH